jgi:hypothetical protein
MKILHTALVIATIGLFTSCTVLTPSGPNVPLFKDRGEKMVNANLIIGGSAVGGEVKGAVATSDHFYLGGNVSAVSFIDGGSGFMTEVGAGGFGGIGKEGIFDMSGGIGYGSAFGDRQLKAYLQPAIGWRRERIEVAGGIKATYLNAEGASFEGEVLTDNLILEPFLIGRFGGEKTKFQVGFNYPTLIASSDGFAIPVMNVTLGVIFRFGQLK